MRILHHPILKNTYLQLLDPCFSSIMACELLELSHGELLLEQGDELHHLYFLVKRKVKVYSTSADGKRLIVAFNSPTMLYGDIEFLQQTPILNTVEALGTIHVLKVTTAHARDLRKQTEFDQYLLQSISRKFLTKSQVLSFHLMHEAETRLACYLCSISHDENNRLCEPFVKKSDLKSIAEFINISVRHQNRIIQSWIEQGILQRVQLGLLIHNPILLKQLAKDNIYEMQ